MNSNGGSSFFGSDWLGAFLIIAILFGGGLGWGGGGRGPMPVPDVATKEFVQEAVNNQALQQGQKEILLSSANNNYETARLISEQNLAMMQQNNTNLVNAIQGFNSVTSTIQAQGAGIQEAISRLSYQLDSCCCGLKTQMLQDKYDRLYEQYRSVQTDASNAAQSQYLLGVMGKWVANPAAV